MEWELKQNDIIVQTVGSRPPLYDSMVGKTIMVNIDFEGSLLNQNSVRIRMKDGSNIYLFAHLKTKRYLEFIETIVRGNANQVSITLVDLFLFEIPLPPISEQLAIAHILGLIDSNINQNNQLITQKELQKKWLMQNLLTGKKRLKQNLQNSGINKINNEDNSGNHENSDNSGSDKWKEVHIRDIAKEVSLKNKSDNQLTVLSCTKYNGLVESLEYWGRKIFADDISTYKIVPKNHFAYATNHIEEGSIGYQDSFDEALISPIYTVFKTNSSINDNYFYMLLKSYLLIYQYQNRMEGSIDRRGGLRWDAFSIIKILIPSYEEQTAIAQVLQSADKEIQLLKTKTEKLREQKKGMMQVLLTGKKRLKI